MTLLVVAKRRFERLRVPVASVIATGVTTLLDFALTPGGIAARLLQREPCANVALGAA
jgi:hypothetical protein